MYNFVLNLITRSGTEKGQCKNAAFSTIRLSQFRFSITKSCYKNASYSSVGAWKPNIGIPNVLKFSFTWSKNKTTIWSTIGKKNRCLPFEFLTCSVFQPPTAYWKRFSDHGLNNQLLTRHLKSSEVKVHYSDVSAFQIPTVSNLTNSNQVVATSTFLVFFLAFSYRGIYFQWHSHCAPPRGITS